MDAQRWQRVSAVFDVVIEAPPDQQPQLLAQMCGSDAELRHDVDALLLAHARTDGFDDEVNSAKNLAAIELIDAGATPGGASIDQIGPWRLIREIGRGGMGVVMLAERADGQFEQTAALKLIKRGMDSDAVLSRFLRERQILARLQHPHIARLLDGGIAADGRPYFAMEFIAGEPLADYCASREVKLEERLRIFLQVCSAVQFAHGQLIVHRDIKPSNILVTADGSAKLLDFGIAKLLTAENLAATATAPWNDRPLTPAYAAPEQLRGEPATVATDVYGLGCVLYELLTARRPFEIEDSPTLDQLQRRLDIASPQVPSQVGAGSRPIAARRLRGDLDTIMLKALAREPARRYATVDALQEDLRSYLHGMPIAARRDRGFYRLQKFVGRHRLGVAMSLLALLALLASTGFAFWQAQAKAREAESARQVTRFVVGLFADSDPTHSNGATVTARDLLDQGAQRLRHELGTEPVLRARLLHTMATTYGALGSYDRAISLEQESLQLRRQHLSPGDPELADSIDELGQLQSQKGDYATAEPLLRDALAMRSATHDGADPAMIESYSNLGALLQNRGQFAQADDYLRRALAASEKTFGAESPETAGRLDDYAANLDNLGKPAESIAALRRALAIREKALGPDSPEVATSLLNLGTILDLTDNFKEPVPMLERCAALRQRIYGASHPLYGMALLALAGAYQSKSRFEDAENTAKRALTIFQHSLPEDHPKTAEALNLLAINHNFQRDYAQAAELSSDVTARYLKKLGPDHPDTISAQNNLALTLLYAGRAAEAEPLLRGALAHVRPDNGQRSDVLGAQNLASILEQEGKTAEAVTFAKRALEREQQIDGENSGNYAVALRSLAIAEQLNGDDGDAEAHFRSGLRIGDGVSAKANILVYPWRLPLADFLAGHQRCGEALPQLQSAQDELAQPGNAADVYTQPDIDLLRGYCLSQTGRREEGLALEAKAREALRKIPSVALDLGPTARRLMASGGVSIHHAPRAAGKAAGA